MLLHLVYQDAKSASVAGHKQHSHAVVSVENSDWFKSKEAFMALVLKAFERMYDEMKIEHNATTD